MNGCIALGRLALPSCGRLRELDAAGCSRLRTVACPSETLRSVSVHACAELVVRPLVTLRSWTHE